MSIQVRSFGCGSCPQPHLFTPASQYCCMLAQSGDVDTALATAENLLEAIIFRRPERQRAFKLTILGESSHLSPRSSLS